MKPQIDATEFGSITIENSVIEHDVLIRLSGEIRKKLSKFALHTPFSFWATPISPDIPMETLNKSVRPEPVEGPFLVRQAHHERLFSSQFSQ